MKNRYKVTVVSNRNILSGTIKPDTFTVTSDAGLYGTLKSRSDAEIIAHGLNNGFTQHILGGFSDATVDAIKKAMAV